MVNGPVVSETRLFGFLYARAAAAATVWVRASATSFSFSSSVVAHSSWPVASTHAEPVWARTRVDAAAMSAAARAPSSTSSSRRFSRSGMSTSGARAATSAPVQGELDRPDEQLRVRAVLGRLKLPVAVDVAAVLDDAGPHEGLRQEPVDRAVRAGGVVVAQHPQAHALVAARLAPCRALRPDRRD